jgi:hypothetical protein
MNNLRTVPSLGVDKFTSKIDYYKGVEELVNLSTLYAWKQQKKKKTFYIPFFVVGR